MRRVLALVTIAAAVLAGSAQAAKPKLNVVVSAESHHPVLHHTWTYQVRVTVNGKPVACKIHVQVFFNGFSVGEVGTHVLAKGFWKEAIPATGKDAFPPASVGQHVVWHVIATAKSYATGVGAFPISVVK
jgi:hypothetical protein